MFRIFTVLGLTFGTLAVATAGTLVPVNLATSPLGMATCSDASAPCTPSVTSTASNTYLNNTFGSLILTGAPTPSSSPQNLPTGASNTPFILATQASNSDDAFYGTNTASLNASIVVDLGTCTGVGGSSTCGVFNVDNIYTLIQGNGDAFGFQGVTVTLNGVTPLGGAVTDTINLTAGVDYRSTNSSGLGCTDANSNNPTNNIGTACTAEGSVTAQATGTDSTPGGTGGNTVLTFNNVAGGTLSGTSYFMDVQELELGTNFLGDYLNSITITSTAPVGVKARMLFSGVTVDEASTSSSSPTPEPGTIGLLGFGAILMCGFSKMRSRRASAPCSKA